MAQGREQLTSAHSLAQFKHVKVQTSQTNPLNYTGISFTVRDARVPLWSEVQLSTEGHHVYRNGHPESGSHGVGFKSNPDAEPYAFAPYHFDRE